MMPGSVRHESGRSFREGSAMPLILKALLFVVLSVVGFWALCWVLNWLSYTLAKYRVLRTRSWGLNICCGHTDGGGVNADIVKHADIPNFVLVSDIYALPFADNQFDDVLCSHTLEHVDDPGAFFAELQRVGRSVTIVVPPLWDISAVLNFFEHKWIFLSFRKVHHTLPPHVPLPGAKLTQRMMGQRIRA